MINKHNKKRNVGIIYELLMRHISNLLITGKKSDIKKATRIIEMRFKKGTELFKEFRIFNGLINTSIESKELALSLINEAKSSSRKINQKKLQKEKSFLIKEINHILKDSKFYHRSIPNYRQYANLQNLINEWKNKDYSSLKSIAEKEQKMLNWLLKEKISKINEKVHTNTETSQLVIGLMTEKINEKYSSFSQEQKEIIQNYALYADADQEKFKSYLSSKKNDILKEIKIFKEKCDNNILLEKVDNVYRNIESINHDEINDENIVKYLTITKLLKELKI